MSHANNRDESEVRGHGSEPRDARLFSSPWEPIPPGKTKKKNEPGNGSGGSGSSQIPWKYVISQKKKWIPTEETGHDGGWMVPNPPAVSSEGRRSIFVESSTPSRQEARFGPRDRISRMHPECCLPFCCTRLLHLPSFVTLDRIDNAIVAIVLSQGKKFKYRRILRGEQGGSALCLNLPPPLSCSTQSITNMSFPCATLSGVTARSTNSAASAPSVSVGVCLFNVCE